MATIRPALASTEIADALTDLQPTGETGFSINDPFESREQELRLRLLLQISPDARAAMR